MGKQPIEYRINFGNFGIANQIDAVMLLDRLVKDIEETTGVVSDERLVVIQSAAGHPSLYGYSNEGGDSYHEMSLVPDPNDPVKGLVFQFSHEYMHHQVNEVGKRGMPSHLLWFEEMLCHISSFYFPGRLGRACGIPRLSESPRLPLDQSRIDTFHAIDHDMQNDLGVPRHLELLTREGGNPPGFCLIPAGYCQRLFVENPSLWQVVRHFRNVPDETDIQGVFAHLRETADDSYRESLEKLIALLLP